MKYHICFCCSLLCLGLLFIPQYIYADDSLGNLEEFMKALGESENCRFYEDQKLWNLEFNRKTLAGAYERVGQRNEKWDEDAKLALECIAKEMIYGFPDELSKEERRALLKRLDKSGCNDPLVLYACGVISSYLKDYDKCWEYYIKSFKDSDIWSVYPPNRRAKLCYLEMSYSIGPRKKDYKRFLYWFGNFQKEVNCWWTEGCYASESQFISELDPGSKIDNDKAQNQYLDFMESFANEMGNCWVSHMIRGEVAIRRGWISRGYGYANTVTAEGWKNFRTQYKVACKEFTAAWQIAPERHLPATRMLSICRWLHFGEAIKIKWFKRALKGCLDNNDTFKAMSGALLPHWGGSHKEMLTLAKAYLAAGHPDSLAPILSLKVLADIKRNLKRNFKGKKDIDVYWSQEEVWKCYDDALAAIISSDSHARWHDWYKSYRVAIAWRYGKFKHAQALYISSKGNFMPIIFKRLFDVDAKDAISDFIGNRVHVDNVEIF